MNSDKSELSKLVLSLPVPQMPNNSLESNSSQKRFEGGPDLPAWNVILDITVNKDINDVFQLLLTDSQFYRSWLDARKSENIHNVDITEWREIHGKIVRNVKYDVTRNFGITTASLVWRTSTGFRLDTSTTDAFIKMPVPQDKQQLR